MILNFHHQNICVGTYLKAIIIIMLASRSTHSTKSINNSSVMVRSALHKPSKLAQQSLQSSHWGWGKTQKPGKNSPQNCEVFQPQQHYQSSSSWQKGVYKPYLEDYKQITQKKVCSRMENQAKVSSAQSNSYCIPKKDGAISSNVRTMTNNYFPQISSFVSDIPPSLQSNFIASNRLSIHGQENTLSRVEGQRRDSQDFSDAESQDTNLSNKTEMERLQILKNLNSYQQIIKKLHSQNEKLEKEVKIRDEAIAGYEKNIRGLTKKIGELKDKLLNICNLNKQQQQQIRELKLLESQLIQNLSYERQERIRLGDSIEEAKQQVKKEVKMKNNKLLNKQRLYFQSQQKKIQKQLKQMKMNAEKTKSELSQLKDQVDYYLDTNYYANNGQIFSLQQAVNYYEDKLKGKVRRVSFYPLTTRSPDQTFKNFRFCDKYLTFWKLQTGTENILGNTFDIKKGANFQIGFQYKGYKQNGSIDDWFLGIGVDVAQSCSQHSFLYLSSSEDQLVKLGINTNCDWLTFRIAFHFRRIDDDFIIISQFINGKIIESKEIVQSSTKFRLSVQIMKGANQKKKSKLKAL